MGLVKGLVGGMEGVFFEDRPLGFIWGGCQTRVPS